MPFSEDTIYLVANDKLKREIENDPVLSYNFYWIKPGTLKGAKLPAEGLFAIRNIVNPQYHDSPYFIPWDAIWSKKRTELKFHIDRSSYEHPPMRMLERIHELTTTSNSKAFYYTVSTHGGDFMHEYAWIFAEDQITILAEDNGEEYATYINGKKAKLTGDVLYLALTSIGVETESETGWFEPHTGGFPWHSIRLSLTINGEKKLPPFPTSLYRSATLGDYDSVKKCMDEGISPLVYNDILAKASASGNVQIVQLLLDQKVKIENRWNSALNTAQNRETIELLLKHGAKINHKSNPLAYVAGSGNEDAVRYMIERGAKMVIDKENKLWFGACKGGIVFLLEELFTKLDPQCTYILDNGLTIAAENNRLDAVKWLFSKGVELQLDALINAAQHGHIETVKWLLENTPLHIDAQNGHGYSALYKAATYNQLPMVNFLLEKGADPHQRHDSYEFSLIHAAAFHGSIAMIERFLELGISIDCTAKDLRTPLWIAVDWQDQEKVNYLLGKGANVNLVDPYGETLQQLANRKQIKI